MIQAVMLITLGFLLASLLGILVAPSLWSRAYRLSKKRLEQSLPLSLSEIEANRDQLRASYAVRLRRLETALASAKQKAALQLVDNSRLQMQIAALKDTIADLELKLSERRNAATVLEQTITKRFPELEREIAALKAQLTERSFELQDLTNRLSRRDEALEAAQRAATNYEEELSRLRQSLEKASADRSGRRLRKPSQWSLDDYRAEYDRLNLELSRLRQQLAQFQDRDAQQVGLIKGELQKLAELILASAQPRQEARLTADKPEAGLTKRPAATDLRRDRPLPWPESRMAKPVTDARPSQASVAQMKAEPLSLSPEEETRQALDVPEIGPERGGRPADRAPIPESLEGVSARAFVPDSASPVKTVANGAGASRSDDEGQGERKPFADARDLKALSELLAINQGNGGSEKTASDESSSSVADEAKKGTILDLDPVDVTTEDSGSSGGQAHNRTLLERLRNLASGERVEADK